MKNENPIAKAISRHGYTQEYVANKLNVSRQAVQRWTNGKPPLLRNLKKLSTLLDVPIAYLTGEDSCLPNEENQLTINENDKLKNLILIPHYDVYAASDSVDNFAVGLVGVPAAIARTWTGVTSADNLHLIKVLGDSMEPTIPRDGVAIIDRNQVEILSDGIYCLSVRKQIFCKRIQRQLDGSLLLISDNPIYKSMTLPQEQFCDVKIIGRLVQTIKINPL